MLEKTCDIDNFEHNKKYLNRYKKTLQKIERLEKRLEDIENRVEIDTKVDNDIVLKETIYRIERLKKHSQEIRIEIYNEIDKLEDFKEVKILESFFIFCKDFETIAEEQCYSVRHVIRTYSRAIRRLDL